MEITKTINGQTLQAEFAGKFTFADNKSFNALISEAMEGSDITILQIDIAKLEFIDSSALGLLLMLNETAAKKGKQLVIKNPQGHVKKVFEVSKFYNIFNII